MLLNTYEDAADTGLNAREIVPDIRAAGLRYSSDVRERRLARRGEVLEMRLDAIRQSVSSRLRGSTMPAHVPTARLNDLRVLTGGGGH
jgi:hypothetical protein